MKTTLSSITKTQNTVEMVAVADQPPPLASVKKTIFVVDGLERSVNDVKKHGLTFGIGVKEAASKRRRKG